MIYEGVSTVDSGVVSVDGGGRYDGLMGLVVSGPEEQ